MINIKLIYLTVYDLTNLIQNYNSTRSHSKILLDNMKMCSVKAAVSLASGET